MIKFSVLCALLLSFASQAYAQSVQAARPIKANSTISPDDLVLVEANVPGAIANLTDAVGLEARRTLYPGRPVMISDLGPVSIVERNQLVELVFSMGTLRISADGRALGRAALGQRVRVMNSDSRLTVTGTVIGPSIVEVRR